MTSHVSPEIERTPSWPQKAAIDLTLGHGVDSFLNSQPPQDPWARASFVTLVDVAVNHADFCYPLPMRPSFGPLEVQLPASIDALVLAGVMKPFEQEVAEDRSARRQALADHYVSFAKFAASNFGPLKAWIDFQQPNRAEYADDVPERLTEWTRQYWVEAPRVQWLAGRVGVDPERLRDAFDATFRAQQYDAILGDNGVTYFPHQLRVLAYKDQTSGLDWSMESIPWSWGRYLAEAVDRGWMPRDPERIAEIVASLRSRVGQKDATWYGLWSKDAKVQQDVLTTIAAESQLPAQLKESVGQWVVKAQLAIGVAGGVYTALNPDPTLMLITAAWGAGAIPAAAWRPRIPSPVVRFARGAVEWPGLLG